MSCLLIHGFNFHLLTSQSNGTYYSRVEGERNRRFPKGRCNMRKTAASLATNRQRTHKLCTISEVHVRTDYLPTNYLGTVNYLLALKKDGAWNTQQNLLCNWSLCQSGDKWFLAPEICFQAIKVKKKIYIYHPYMSIELILDTWHRRAWRGPYRNKAWVLNLAQTLSRSVWTS